MDAKTMLAELLRYGDAMNEKVLAVAGALSDEQLDRPLDLGPGSVRRICRHLLAGESTWLARMRGEVEARWPDEKIPLPIAAMLDELRSVRAQREAFLSTVSEAQLDRVQRYRDSRGSLYQATLQQMLLQAIVHSIHHRAQIVNGIRRVGGQAPELDLMYSVRRPA